MKKILFSILALLSVGMVHAQLRVDSLGNIRINTTTNSNYKFDIASSETGLRSTVKNSTLLTTTAIEGTAWHQVADNTAYGVKGTVSGYWLDGACYGVYGATNTSRNSKNYGVWGSIAPNVSGAAVYGTIYYSSIALDDHYAGYFEGPVKVQGNLNVTGTMLNASAPSTSSPLNFSSQQDMLRGGVSMNLQSITPQRFRYEQSIDLVKEGLQPEDQATADTVNQTYSLIARQVVTKQHYGLSADELEEVFPDLVYENEDGSKSINYVEMVPILVQAINELSAKVASLEDNNASARKVADRATNIQGIGDDVQLLSLGQNRPNPFGSTTEIEVSVPETVQSAFVYVYDLQGKKVQQVNITARGKQTVQLDATDLSDGMYLYSLITDGKVVDTRRMIVEK